MQLLRTTKCQNLKLDMQVQLSKSVSSFSDISRTMVCFHIFSQRTEHSTRRRRQFWGSCWIYCWHWIPATLRCWHFCSSSNAIISHLMDMQTIPRVMGTVSRLILTGSHSRSPSALTRFQRGWMQIGCCWIMLRPKSSGEPALWDISVCPTANALLARWHLRRVVRSMLTHATVHSPSALNSYHMCSLKLLLRSSVMIVNLLVIECCSSQQSVFVDGFSLCRLMCEFLPMFCVFLRWSSIILTG